MIIKLKTYLKIIVQKYFSAILLFKKIGVNFMNIEIEKDYRNISIAI